MANYFNTLSLREKLSQLGVCEFMDGSQFADGVTALKGKKIVIVGAGAQGLNQGLNLRDSGLDVSYALRKEAIEAKRASWKGATENGFKVGTYEELIPSADLVINLTPDKQHTSVVSAVMPLMKQGATLSYSHGAYAAKLIQYGWEVVTEALKQGGITAMMDRLSNPAKIKAFELAEELKTIMRPLFQKHQDDIMSGEFSKTMMEDWANDDKNLLTWRAATGETAFEKTAVTSAKISEQEFFDNGLLLVAFVKSGVELAFETMVQSGIKAESAYYESLHETPLIANTIARKKLFEMNRVISDTAEYGCYLFDHACKPLLADFMKKIDTDVIGTNFNAGKDNGVDNKEIIAVNKSIRAHQIEEVGATLRAAMTAMKSIATVA